MNGATFSRVIKSPLIRPTRTPSAKMMTMISGMLKNSV